MAAQILSSRGRSLGSSLPKLVTSRLTSSPSCRFFSPGLENNSNNNNDEPPPTKTHAQSFVQSDIDLELGELETHLPPGFHQNRHREQRGAPKPRPHGDGRDSYWRPPWKTPRAEIVSAEDFANRPRVTFSESFASMHDAMAVLSWMTQGDKDGMYGLYLNMMTAIAEQQESKLGKLMTKKDAKETKDEDWQVLSTHTSHEYVIRVVAQKYNVTTSRAAGVIQLQHNEEQLKKDPDFHVNHGLQAHVDLTARDQIKQVYASYGEKDPLQFVEDPIASTGDIGRTDLGSPTFLGASELTDVDALFKKTRNQELEDARVRIKNHVYVEDVDEQTRKVRIDKEASRLLKMGAELGSLYEDFKSEDKEAEVKEAEGEEGDSKEDEKTLAANQTKVPKLPPKPAAASPYPDNNRGHNETPKTRRPRWKYAAQIINTHMLENPADYHACTDSTRRGKMVAKRTKGRRHGRVVDGNTIIEQDGKLRAASVAELQQTSWKHVRNESEFMFNGVKDAWLKRQLGGEVGGWGLQEEVLKVDPKKLIEGENKEDEEGDDGAEGEEAEGAAEEGSTEGTDDKKE